MVLPFSSDAGVAILRRGDETDLFFDERLPLDLSGIQDDQALGKARVSVLSEGTLIRLPAPSGGVVNADRRPGGWEISIGTGRTAIPVGLSVGPRSVDFSMAQPGRVVVAADPADGSTILIGTTRSGSSSMPLRRRSVAFEALESQAGVIVRPNADDMVLRRTQTGFELRRSLDRPIGATSDLGAKTPGGGLSRTFRLPAIGDADLAERLRGQLLRSALAPESSRLGPRLDIAETLIGLGLGREARTVLAVAAADDPSFAEDARADGLMALATLLSGQTVDPGDWAIAEHRPSDELDLWQSLSTDPAAPRATLDRALVVLDADGALIDRYPDHVAQFARRRRALLLLARGLPADLDKLIALTGDPATVVAKAIATARRGDPNTAATLLDAPLRSRDLGIAASAMLARAEVDVRTGRLTPLAAAAMIRSHDLDWRATGLSDVASGVEADDLEHAGRYREAISLRNALGVRSAALRDTGAAAIAIDLERLGDPSVTPPPSASDLSDVLIEETGMLSQRPLLKRRIETVLVDRLDRLGLPGRAADILGGLIDDTGSAAEGERMQERLSELRLRSGDVAAARRAFDLVQTRDLDAGELARHALLGARLLAREQRPEEALAAMSAVRGADADDLRAGLLATCGRWHEAKTLLAELARSWPSDGTLDARQTDDVIRLATASARDGDQTMLLAVAARYDRRLPDERSRTSLRLMASAL